MVSKQKMRIGGDLYPHKRDISDFHFASVHGFIDVKTLPKTYRLASLEIKNQFDSFLCTSHALSTVSEFQEGITLEPAFTAKLTSEEAGFNINSNGGTDLRTAAKTALKGFLEKKDSPYKLPDKTGDFVANPNNWAITYNTLADKHKKQAFFWVDTYGYKDFFDACKGAMWIFKEEKRALLTETTWHDNWTYQSLIKEAGNPTGGHCIAIIGWDEIDGQETIIIQNSYGEEVGDKGFHYFTRDIFNKFFTFSAIMFCDLPNHLIKKDVKIKSQWYNSSFFEKLWLLITGGR